MQDCGKLFWSPEGSGLYAVGGAAAFEKIGRLAVSSGLKYIYIDLATVKDKQAFLKILAERLAFPAYFGMNWDALKDSLTDMRPAGGWVIAFDNVKGFAKADPAGMDTAREIFEYAAGYWRKQVVSFYLLTKFESA